MMKIRYKGGGREGQVNKTFSTPNGGCAGGGGLLLVYSITASQEIPCENSNSVDVF